MPEPQAVTVPPLVGMPFHHARDAASALGLALAGPDPDGPPVSTSAWPGFFVIATQSPAAGTASRRGASIVVTVVPEGPDADADVGAPTTG